MHMSIKFLHIDCPPYLMPLNHQSCTPPPHPMQCSAQTSSSTYLQELLGGSGCGIICRLPVNVILVLFTVHALVDGLAQQAVGLVADGAGEVVDIVLVHAPTRAVCRLAVEGIFHDSLCLGYSTLLKLLKLSLCQHLHTTGRRSTGR